MSVAATVFAVYYLFGQGVLALGLLISKPNDDTINTLRKMTVPCWLLAILAHVMLLFWPVLVYWNYKDKA
jgi:hypothetical protein